MKMPFIPPQAQNLIIQQKRYNPNRDLAYIGTAIVHVVLDYMVETDEWRELVRTGACDEEALCESAISLGKFFKICSEDKNKDVFQAYEESGLGLAKSKELSLVLEAVGIVMIGSTFNAIRDTTVRGEAADMHGLLEAADTFYQRYREKNSWFKRLSKWFWSKFYIDWR